MDKKVTKRSIEKVSDSTVFGYSEYFRLSEVVGNNPYAIPKLYAGRILTRYKLSSFESSSSSSSYNNNNNNIISNQNNQQQQQQQQNIPVIEGLERYYLYPAESLDSPSEKPLALIKSKLKLSKLI